MMARTPFVCLGFAALVWSAGCSAPGVETRTFQRIVVDDATPDQVFAESVRILRREFGSLEVDNRRLEAMSGGSAYEARTNSGAGRDLYRGSSTMRRFATLKVAASGVRAVASLRIDLQRRDDDRRDAFLASDSRLSDSPGYTPIERDAARSTGQNTTWTNVGRDRDLERSLLNEIADFFGPATPPTETAPAATEATGG